MSGRLKLPENTIHGRSEEFTAFMKTAAAQYADREVRVVVDNLGKHFTAEVHNWLTTNPNTSSHSARSTLRRYPGSA